MGSTQRLEQETLIGSSSIRAPNKDARVHNLPCTVEHDGPAAVATYFQPKESADGEGVVEAAFRGRLLKGAVVACPPGTVGLVAREAPLPPELREQYPSSSARFWSVESQFQDMTLWSHDSVPARDHPLYGLGEWLEVARAIHED